MREEIDHSAVAAKVTQNLKDELVNIGNRHPKVPRRDLDFIMTLALRLAGSMVSADRQRRGSGGSDEITQEVVGANGYTRAIPNGNSQDDFGRKAQDDAK